MKVKVKMSLCLTQVPRHEDILGSGGCLKVLLQCRTFVCMVIQQTEGDLTHSAVHMAFISALLFTCFSRIRTCVTSGKLRILKPDNSLSNLVQIRM